MKVLIPMLTAAVVLGFASNAMADEYYIVKSPDTHKCKVVTTKPAKNEVVTQIGPVAFKTEQEAQTKIKTVKDCDED